MREKMLHIAERLEKRADAIMTILWREYWDTTREYEEGAKNVHLKKEDLPPLSFPFSPTAKALNIMAEEIRETLSTPEYETYDNNGDVFTIKEFEEHCNVGPLFVNSDGTGYYAKEADGHISMVRNRPAVPSRIAGGDVNEKFTHVVWYNK